MDKKKGSSKKLRIFDFTRNGKGISKSSVDKNGGFKRFFYTLKNNFGKIVSVNIFMVLGNFPLFFLICNLSGYFKTPFFIPMSDLFQNISGIFATQAEATPFQMTLFALEGLQNQSLAPTLVTYIFYGLGALTLFTFGLVNVGTAYILRNIASGEPVFVWSDFWYAIKRNYKQALPFGMIDLLISSILFMNIYLTMTGTADFLVSVMFWCSVVISLLYFFMRYYIYVQMVTFKLTVFKILKNSLIFALLGFKRNILAFLGIVLGLVLEFIFLFGSGGILVPFAVAAPLALIFALFAYMKVYASYFKIKEVMIDPYYAEHPEERHEVEVESIMVDDVTENERLEEIKRKNGIK